MDTANLGSTDRQLLPSVCETLSALATIDTDAAAAQLAKTLARAIDDAKAAERWADTVLRNAAHAGDDELLDQVNALRVKLTAKATLNDLAPKLTAILVELGATPKSRAALAKLRPAESAQDPSQRGLLALVSGVPPGA